MANATVTTKETADGRKINVITPATPQPDKVFLTADQIFDADDIDTEDVYIEKWDGWVTLRQMTLQDEYDLRKRATVGGELDEPLLDALLVSQSMVNPEMPLERARELLRKNRRVMHDLLSSINRMNKRTGEGLKQLEATFLEAARQGTPVPTGQTDGDPGPGTAEQDVSTGVQ